MELKPFERRYLKIIGLSVLSFFIWHSILKNAPSLYDIFGSFLIIMDLLILLITVFFLFKIHTDEIGLLKKHRFLGIAYIIFSLLLATIAFIVGLAT